MKCHIVCDGREASAWRGWPMANGKPGVEVALTARHGSVVAVADDSAAAYMPPGPALVIHFAVAVTVGCRVLLWRMAR